MIGNSSLAGVVGTGATVVVTTDVQVVLAGELVDVDRAVGAVGDVEFVLVGRELVLKATGC